MSIVYLDGHYLPLSEAKISVLDRGFLFADSVYEVIPAYGRRLFRLSQHLERLQLSLQGIHMQNPLSNNSWENILNELILRNEGNDLSLYLQISRGADTQRQHLFPADLKPTIFAMSSPIITIAPEVLKQGIKVITLEDIRWRYRNLKTTALLANVLLRLEAEQQNAEEAILIQDGHASECTSSNFFLVKQDRIITPPKSERLLPGITRDLILELAAENSIPFEEKIVSINELKQADEIWISSSSKELMPVTHLDGTTVSNGQPGPLWQTLYSLFQNYKDRLRKHMAH